MKTISPLYLIVAALLAACSNDDKPQVPLNTKPSFVSADVLKASYDGASNDLLTAGLGKSGLAGAAPAFVDAANPTATELRRNAIYNNYRALVDITAAGGFGVLYGLNINANGQDAGGEGKIAGDEWLAYADDGTGTQNVTMMVQIPSTFSADNPCIVAAPSSGSRGVYGAIGTAGEWGLKKGCAVAYTDKGTGNGAHDLATNRVTLIDGTRSDAANAGRKSAFTANVNDADRAAFNTQFPNRWAFKHAHSQKNPEKDWGRDVLQAIEFAFWALNEARGDKNNSGDRVQTFRPENTLVIASSVSNGGGASLAAAEQDTKNLIDGVAVGEPQIQVSLPSTVSIRRGANAIANAGKGLYDYTTLANLYQPCAALATSGAPGGAFVSATLAANRCQALYDQGILARDGITFVAAPTVGQIADTSLSLLGTLGWSPESALLHASHYAFATPPIAVTYANTHAQAKVTDRLCGFSFAAAVSGQPAPLAAAAAAQVFANGNGIPPTAGTSIINDRSVGGPLVDGASVSASTSKQDFNVDGARCLRELFSPNPAALYPPDFTAQIAALKKGVDEVKRTANLKAKPAIIVHGRADALVPVNHSSRPYTALNKSVEGAASKLSYIEVTNAQHFDAFIGNAALAGYDTRFVPLHVYFNRAMDAMYNHLKSGAALPPSQLVRTTPRGGEPGKAPPITAANVPAFSAAPAAADQIVFSNNTLAVPE